MIKKMNFVKRCDLLAELICDLLLLGNDELIGDLLAELRVLKPFAEKQAKCNLKYSESVEVLLSI